MDKPKILILCTGNSARSQMAEALFRRHGGDHYDVYSAGIEPKGIHPLTRRVMQEAGLDLAGQRSKDVREYLDGTTFAYVFTVCSNAEERCPRVLLSMGEHAHWGLEDPAAQAGNDAQQAAKFRTVRDQIDAHVRAWMAQRDPAAG